MRNINGRFDEIINKHKEDREKLIKQRVDLENEKSGKLFINSTFIDRRLNANIGALTRKINDHNSEIIRLGGKL